MNEFSSLMNAASVHQRAYQMLCFKTERLILSRRLLPLPPSTSSPQWILWTASSTKAEFSARSCVFLNESIVNWILERGTLPPLAGFNTPVMLYNVEVTPNFFCSSILCGST